MLFALVSIVVAGTWVLVDEMIDSVAASFEDYWVTTFKPEKRTIGSCRQICENSLAVRFSDRGKHLTGCSLVYYAKAKLQIPFKKTHLLNQRELQNHLEPQHRSSPMFIAIIHLSTHVNGNFIKIRIK